MNKKERLMAVLNHEIPDHVPVSFWFHFDGEKGRGEKCVQAHLDYCRACDVDFLKIMCDQLIYPLRVNIDKPEDWFNVRPLPSDDPFFTGAVERCRAISSALRDECYTYYTFFSIMNAIRERDVFTPRCAAGRTNMQIVQEHFRLCPEGIRHALNVIAEDHVRLGERILGETGCLGIYQSLQGAEVGWLAPGEYAGIVRPIELRMLDRLNEMSPYNMLHLCSWSGERNDLSCWKGYPCPVKNWGTAVDQMSMKEGLSFFGPDDILLGGLDNRRGSPLVSGTREEVRAAVLRVLEEMKGVPFILGADCTIPNTTDLERVRWVVETVRREPGA